MIFLLLLSTSMIEQPYHQSRKPEICAVRAVGAPLAHEDRPQRALYAALHMQKEMRQYADRLRAQGHPPLLMRVGVNTGEVVVRSIRKEDLHTDYVPVGHATNLAARMEQLAAPGSILVTAYTHRLTEGYFEFKALGQTQLKGVEEPLNVYEVLGTGRLRTRLQVAARRGLTRFVGRQGELEQLRRALAQATAGHGQIVGVMGEPGLGKSRLFYEFKLTSQSRGLVLEKISEALTLAHRLSHPFSIAFTLSFTLYLHWFRREPRAVQERAKALETLATELGFHHMWMPLWQIYGGWALTEQGYGSDGVQQIKQGFASYEATEMTWGLPHLRAILASAYEKAGETERSLGIVAEALEGAQQTGECFYEAELYRLKGTLTLQQFKVQGSTFNVAHPQPLTPNPQTEAEACFLMAIEIAQRQQAKSLELRAAMNLARLWQQQDRKEEARQMLTDIYGWFTEGFDTRDLQEAKTLLERLA